LPNSQEHLKANDAAANPSVNLVLKRTELAEEATKMA
jgi:hypothetical protein